MSILKTAARSKAVRLGLAATLAGAALVGAVGTSSAQAAVAKGTASPSTGPTTVGTVFALTGAGFATAGGATVADVVSFQTAACTATPGGSNATNTAVISATRIVATAPALTLTASKPTLYNICVHDTDPATDVLLATATYTAYAPPTIAGVNNPASGPAAGGNTIVVSGTNFTSKSVVKFGSFVSPKVVVAKDGLSLTAVAPAQAAGAVAVSVTTEGGTNATPTTATDDDYTYSNAITVSPTTGLRTAAQVVTVKGVGFKGATLNFGGNSAVRVVQGAYVDSTNEGTACGNVQVVSDTELVCTIAANSIAAEGAYTITVVDNTTAAPVFKTVVSSSATYTAAAF